MLRSRIINKSERFGHVATQINSSVKSGYKTRSEAMVLLQTCVGETAWNKLYRKELFNNVFYPIGFLYEDVGTTYKTVWKSSCIYYLNKELYFKCYRGDSISAIKTEKSLHHKFAMFMQQYHDLVAWGYPQDKLDRLLQINALDYCIMLTPRAFDENYSFCKKVLLKCRCIPSGFSWKRKIMFVIFKNCYPLFELICILLDKRVRVCK